MHLSKCTLLLCAIFELYEVALSISHENIPDFEFESESPPDYFYPDDELRNVERMVLSEMAEDEPTTFNEKEKRIRDALLRSTQDVRNRRTLSQVLPILRSISKPQRLALAALISAQTTAKAGDELNLKQVEEMFGERRNLILPVIFDIANIVKDMSQEKKHNSRYQSVTADAVNTKRHSMNEAPTEGQRTRLRRSVKPSYHERKLNMTDFRGNYESNDQQAIESNTRIHVTLPNPNSTIGLSLEEIESMALSELNGTGVLGAGIHAFPNGTVMENLPEPEMLIRPYRVRPRPISERFDNIYLYVADYPIQDIMGSIRRHRYAMTALLADNPNEWVQHLEEMEAKKRREDEEDNVPASGMCPSIVRYARPQKARSSSGEWKYIVNTGQHTQTLRLEKCTNPEQTCTYLTDNFSSRCAQVYNYHRLLSWDSRRGLHIDIFKVPTCCNCQIEGYREKFPPVSAHDSDQDQDLNSDTRFSASDALYTVSNDYNDNDEVPFTPIVPNAKKNRYEKRKKSSSKRPHLAFIETFLTPPNKEYIGTDSFKRKQSSVTVINRVADRKNNADPILIGNDDLPEIVSPPSLHTERSNKVHPTIPPSMKNGHLPRLAPSKVLIKRVNYNYHPIIDFFFRDRSIKSAKAKENRTGHSIVS